MFKIEYISFVMLFFISLGCEKENQMEISYSYPQFIYAGQMDGDSILYTPLDSSIIIISGKASTTYYSLDINQDEIDDFSFSIKGIVSPGARLFIGKIEPLDSCSIVVSDLNNEWIDALSQNERIDNKLIFSDTISLLYYRNYITDSPAKEYGLWKNQDSMYVGIRKKNESEIFYGWIRLTTHLDWNLEFIVEIESYAITKKFQKNISN